MPVIEIHQIDDPRLDPYRDRKGQSVMRGGKLFVAEGSKLVERLLESRYRPHSVLVAERKLEQWRERVPSELPLFVVPQEIGDLLAGYKFHAGVVACGYRERSPKLNTVLEELKDREDLTVLICPFCDDPQNLGTIVRIAAAFGVHAMLLGPGCCDPFSRRVLRVSMGTAFKMPIVVSRRLEQDVCCLREEWGFQTVATVLDTTSLPLSSARRPKRLALMMGNEDQGLSETWLNLADLKVTIPMAVGIDSLNVAVATGIFLHHFQTGTPYYE